MTDSFIELQEMLEPLLRKHPEAITVVEVCELQRVCRYAMGWCEELKAWNEQAQNTLFEANTMLEALICDG